MEGESLHLYACSKGIEAEGEKHCLTTQHIASTAIWDRQCRESPFREREELNRSKDLGERLMHDYNEYAERITVCQVVCPVNVFLPCHLLLALQRIQSRFLVRVEIEA